MIEAWRQATSRHSVSDHGRVRLDVGGNRPAGAIIHQFVGFGGYRFVVLYGDGKQRTCYVHRLVARAFIGECPARLEVNHKNGDKMDNRLCNLEYITRSENHRHAFRLGLSSPRRGLDNEQCVLSPEDVAGIRAARNGGERYGVIAARYGVSREYASQVARGVARGQQ